MDKHKLVLASRLNCPEEKHLEIIERLLGLTRTDNDEATRQLGWILLSRVIPKCTAASFRTVQTRLSKKVAEMSRQGPNIPAALYLRELFLRNPQAGEIHKQTVEDIIYALIDTSLIDGNQQLRDIAVELCAIRYRAAGIERFVRTLDVCMSGSMIPVGERANLVACKALGQSHLNEAFVGVLFDILGEIIKQMKIGDSLPRALVLEMFSTAFKSVTYRDSALRTLDTLFSCAQWAMLPLVPRIVSLLIGLLNEPSPSLFNCLTTICSRFSASSTLYKHVFIIYSSLQHPLHNLSYGQEAANLIAAIISSSGYLVKSEVLCTLQRSVCENALRYSSPPYMTMLEALLCCGNELIPVPVNVARTLISRSLSSSVSSSLLSRISDSLVRPRVHDLASNELRRRQPTKIAEEEEAKNAQMDRLIESVTMIEQTEETIITVEDGEEEEVDMGEDVVESVEDGESGKEEEVEEVTVAAPLPAAFAAPRNPSPQKQKAAKKEEKEEGFTLTTTNFMQQVQKKIKRKGEKQGGGSAEKKRAQEASAHLLEGEASVEDILGSFCPQ